MAFPFAALAMILTPFISKALSGDGTQKTKQTTTAVNPPTGYSSPTVPFLDQMLQDQLARNYTSLAGAGMPGGQANISPYISALMGLLQQNLPSLLEYYQTGGAKQQKYLSKPRSETGGGASGGSMKSPSSPGVPRMKRPERTT